MLNLHILGIQGCGKGTQAHLLEQRLGLTYLGSGELLRQRALTQDALGLKIQSFLQAGLMIPDTVMSELLHEQLQATPPQVGLIGDGVIRTPEQVEQFANLWAEYSLDQPQVIYLELSEAAARSRIAHRVTEATLYHHGPVRTDDLAAAIEVRFARFQTQTMPVVNHFKQLGRCLTVDASPEIEVVYQSIYQQIEHELN